MNDLRLAARQLAKSPGFTFVAVATLALGIAATASTFSVVKGLVLDPLPYPESARLGQVWGRDIDETFGFMPLSNPDYLDLEERLTCFEAFGTFSPRRFTIGGENAEVVHGAWCTPGVFRALNVPPLLGRWFVAADVAGESSDAVVILSHAFWQQRFASDTGCIGQTLRLDGRDHTIVGVMPPQFELLSMWTRDRSLAVWTPLTVRRDGGGRTSYWLASIARLKPGESPAHADAELRAVADQIRKSAPVANARRTFWWMPLQQGIGGFPALRVSVLLAAGWTLLVLAAQNVAGMMLARGIGRQTEIAVRIALGASRLRIIRLVLAQSLLLAALASGTGLILTLWFMDALAAILPAAVMPRAGLAVDGWLLSCIACLAAVVLQMAGLAPALLASKTDVVGGLKEAGVSHSSARKTQRRLHRLVIGQLAIALILVSVAMQLSHTYQQMVASSRAVISENIISAAVTVKGPGYNDAARVALWDRLAAAAEALPGVSDAAVTTKLPFSGGVSMTVLTDDEVYDPAKPAVWTEVSYVSPHFFAATNTTLLRGRFLQQNDYAVPRRAVVINRAMAERYWPGQDPIGRHIRPAESGRPWAAEVVGVIENIRQFAERPAKPEMYFPYADQPLPEGFLVVRTAAGVSPPVEQIRTELRRLDPDLALAEVKSMQHAFAAAGNVIAVITPLVNALTVAIVSLAALGLYGTLSFTFTRRRRDIGVRVALGATRRDIIALVLRQALVWVVTGAAIGSAGAWLLGRGVRVALEDAMPVNLAELAASLAVVFAAAALAAWLPAWRATRVNPVEALRAE